MPTKHRHQHTTISGYLTCKARAKLVDLPCGCQDVHHRCGFVDYEHDWVVCDGKPVTIEEK